MLRSHASSLPTVIPSLSFGVQNWMAVRFITLKIDEGCWCSNSPPSHPIKRHFLQVSAHFGGWTLSNVTREVSSTSAQHHGSKTVYGACCSGFQLRARTMGLFWKYSLSFGLLQNIEMWHMANIYRPFCQGTFTELITRRIFMITTITIKKEFIWEINPWAQ